MATKILVVDDSATIREQLKRVLVPAGFELVEARDGLEGLDRVEQDHALGMIICDVHMPRMDGLVLVETLRARDCAVPVLMLTTEGQPDQIRRAKAAGARGWIIKPFDPALLLKAVQSLTSAQRAA